MLGTIGDLSLEFVHLPDTLARGRDARGHYALAFRVDDLDAAIAELRAVVDVEVSGPHTLFGTRAALFRDIEDNLIELTEYQAPSLKEQLPAASLP